MNIPECNDMKVKYEACIKQHVKNTLFAWYDSKVNNSITTSTASSTGDRNNNNNNACDETFQSYKECVDNMMMLRMIENQKDK